MCLALFRCVLHFLGAARPSLGKGPHPLKGLALGKTSFLQLGVIYFAIHFVRNPCMLGRLPRMLQHPLLSNASVWSRALRLAPVVLAQPPAYRQFSSRSSTSSSRSGSSSNGSINSTYNAVALSGCGFLTPFHIGVLSVLVRRVERGFTRL